MNILFNSSGIPLLMQSTYIFGETTGTPRNEMKERTRILAPYDLSNVSYIDIDGVKVRPWGDENDFPQKAAEEIGNTSVLNTGLKFLRNLTLGQGIYPCTVNGYDNDGNEILKPVTDSRVQTFIASRNVRRYMEKVLRDYLKFGNGAVQFGAVGCRQFFCRGQSGQCALPPLFRSGRIRCLQVHRFRILAATSGQGTIHQAGCALRIRPADAR